TVTDTSSVIVLPLTSPIVDVTISDDTVCVGDTVIFTSTVSNVAIPPSYRWYLNGNFAGLNSTYSSYSLSSSDVLVLLIFTPNPCGPDSATDTVSIVVNPITSPGVSLIGSDTICSGDTLSLSAAAINGGVTPQFEWYVNGILLGTDSVYSTSSIINGDSLWVTMMSSDECASPDSTADSTIITVVPSVIPAVLISASEDTICFGDQVVFVALPLGAGAAPSYQWMLNSVPIPGATNSTYTTTLPASSILSVLVTSSAACADPEFAEDTITIVVENCLGIDQPSLSVFSLHPNPATDEVVVDFNSSGFSSRNILIYDALGRILYQQMNVSDKNFHIDISAFSPSIYFVKVIEAEKEYLQKLVVE
ncbi:MAG: T9SS type A sorting domain-containing protein, partial [Bacteroidota bacterium]